MTGDKENKNVNGNVTAHALPQMPDPDRDRMNALPYWFSRTEKQAENAGLKVPKTVWVDIPVEIQRAFYMEDQDDMSKIQDFVENAAMPAARAANIGLLFLKNGVYSHKFSASHACLPTMDNIPNAVMTVMYEAMLRCGFQYDGTDYLVIRERIDSDPRKTPCIYNGLPFRPEYRVFYDCDQKRRINTVEYWDRDYVYDKLYALTDRLIFDAWYDKIHAEYLANRDKVNHMVDEMMSQVSGLAGKWSVDILQDESGNFWFIDMAVAEMSAYWDKAQKEN